MSFTVTKLDSSAGSGLTGIVYEQRQRFVRLYAAETIAKGDCVAIDQATSTYGLGNHIRVAVRSTSTKNHAFGIASEAIASGELGKVQVAGICTFAKVDTGEATVGQLLCAGNASTVGYVAGSLDQYDINVNSGEADMDTIPCAVLLTEVTTDTASNAVLLLNPFNY